jgi:hypothetical protein
VADPEDPRLLWTYAFYDVEVPGKVGEQDIEELRKVPGARVPQLDTILKLAWALTVSPSELIEGMTWRPGDFSPGGFELTGRSATGSCNEGRLAVGDCELSLSRVVSLLRGLCFSGEPAVAHGM